MVYPVQTWRIILFTAIIAAALCIALSSCQSYQPPGSGLDPVVKRVLSNP